MIGRQPVLHWLSQERTKSPKLNELGGQKTGRREAYMKPPFPNKQTLKTLSLSLSLSPPPHPAQPLNYTVFFDNTMKA
jgi:hypothetical protein